MLGRSLRESWRFVRLFGVGLAWGAPLALLAFVNTAPGVAAHPELARLVAPIQWELLVASPFVAVAGGHCREAVAGATTPEQSLSDSIGGFRCRAGLLRGCWRNRDKSSGYLVGACCCG